MVNDLFKTIGTPENNNGNKENDRKIIVFSNDVSFNTTRNKVLEEIKDLRSYGNKP